MRAGRLAALGVLLATLPAPPVAAEDPPPPVPRPALEPLEAAARLLAKAGRLGELTELLDVHGALAAGKSAWAQTEGAALAAEAAKARGPLGPGAEAARAVQRAAAALAKLLPERAGAAQSALAAAIVRLDGTVEAARLALGHEKGPPGGPAWVSPEDRRLLARRTEIQEALRRARRLEVPLESGPSDHAFLTSVAKREGAVVRGPGLTVHSAWSAAKTLRVAREALRATAVSAFLVGDEVGIPPDQEGTFLLLDSEQAYVQAVGWARKEGILDEAAAKEAEQDQGFFAGRNSRVCFATTEAQAEAILLSDLRLGCMPFGDAQPVLQGGHVNWVSLACLGAPLPLFTWKEATETVRGGRPGRGTVAEPGEAEERRRREETRRLAPAGLLGCRSWLTYLAERRDDPPWSRAFVDQVGMIEGEDLLKASLVAQYLQERGPLGSLVLSTKTPRSAGPAERGARIEEALGEPLQSFEARWRRWLSPEPGGLAARLVRPPPPPAPKAERDLLEILDGIRRRAFAGRGISPDPDAIAVERSLAEGARLHALYLARHRAQATTWPEIHEEYPDREGFTVEGAWAGGHAVIALGVSSWREAVDDWMATFYHRLPLLDPGLLRVGGAIERGIAVLDTGSLVRPVPSGWTVFWPPDGATGVPRGFRPEIPEPVPGADPNSLGYPVTLQIHRGTLGDPANVTMTLSRGPDEVPCFFSSPSRPGNPIFVPQGAYGLIPKQPLAGNVTYTVEAQVQGSGATRWRFTTGP